MAYVRLSTEVFAGLVPAGHLSIENAKAASEYGDAQGIFVGNENLAFVWMRCEVACLSGTWN